MKVLRFLLASAAFMIVWVAVAIIVNLAIALVFQPRDSAFFITAPGIVIGLLMGLRWFRDISGLGKKP